MPQSNRSYAMVSAMGWLLLVGAVGAGMFGVLNMVGVLMVGGTPPAVGVGLLVLCLAMAIGATWCLSEGARRKKM